MFVVDIIIAAILWLCNLVVEIVPAARSEGAGISNITHSLMFVTVILLAVLFVMLRRYKLDE